MEEMRKITVRLPAKMFARVKSETGETNAGVLRLALEALVRSAQRGGTADSPDRSGISSTGAD